MLKKLCNQGFLISEGNRRGTKYHVNDPERKVGSSKRLKFEELQSIIICLLNMVLILYLFYITLDEIAKRTNRTFDYIANKIIPRMLKNRTIEYLYPGVPNHPKQKYKATNKKTNNKQ
jgi:ATP-dependent DNA helicase RecG